MAQLREYLRYLAGFDALQESAPAESSSWPIDYATLATWPRFEVVASQLNCREVAYSGAVTNVFTQGAILRSQPSSATRPQVVTDSHGKPWLLVRDDAASSACYVSASYEYIRPLVK